MSDALEIMLRNRQELEKRVAMHGPGETPLSLLNKLMILQEQIEEASRQQPGEKPAVDSSNQAFPPLLAQVEEQRKRILARTLEELEKRAAMHGPGKEPLFLLNQIAELRRQTIAPDLKELERRAAEYTFGEVPPPLLSQVAELRGQLEGVQEQVRQTAIKVKEGPKITAAIHISLTHQEKSLLQHVFRGFGEVLVEKEFGGGYSGTRVLLTLPIASAEAGGLRAARRVTKIGPALELRKERDNYMQHVQGFLPFHVAQVEGERYCELGDQAALNYLFVGDGALGQAVGLEEYFRTASPDAVARIIKPLDELLDKELGQRWYGQTNPLACFFATEYGQHMVEHVRLKLRGVSADALWRVDQPPTEASGYERIEPDAIPHLYETIQPGAKLSVEGMVIKRVKHGQVKLQDPGSRGIIVGVEFSPESDAAAGLEIGDTVGVRGQAVYNRRGRLEEIVSQAFPELPPGAGGECIELPGVPGAHRNPLRIYPEMLSRTLEGRQSYVHGDLHLRNVLVDGGGSGWLIDFARVEKRHNLFDFVKLETYVRLMGLAGGDITFSLNNYVRFEEALNSATLGRSVTPPGDLHLRVAYEVILTIRRIAHKYMARESGFLNEYFPALFLYLLAVMKYYEKGTPQPTRLAFATATVLGQCLTGEVESGPEPLVNGDQPARGDSLGIGRRWAVMAGVNHYQDGDISNLACCVADVQAVHHLLIDPALGGYQSRLLLDTSPDTLPTRNNVLAELSNVAQAVDDEDLLLFYFSGHGIVQADRAYLIPSDARLTNLVDTAVPLHRVKEIMSQSAARAKVIILDACHSGARIGKAEARMSPEFKERVFEEAEGLAILASCQQGQVSYEWEQARQSVFTHYLLEALAGAADFDGKGFVTIQDINRYVTDKVKVWAVERGRSQTPTLGGGWSGDIIVADCPGQQSGE
jgi:hypothetical protein